MNWLTKETLQQTAKQKGYRPEILEKVYRLLDLINEMMNIEFLRDRLALKGGTAINLFHSNTLPRLSVDLDFNYIGTTDRQTVLNEREQMNEVLSVLCKKKQYRIKRNPSSHAGGKLVLIYDSLLNQKGRLELDLNYLYRVPLWPLQWHSSADWLYPCEVPVLDIHELAAGKLHALLSRRASRDLFDSHHLLTQWQLDPEKLRQAFTIYAGMRQNSWRSMTTYMIQSNAKDIRNRLLPVLKRDLIPGTKFNVINEWANHLVRECQNQFQRILPDQVQKLL